MGRIELIKLIKKYTSKALKPVAGRLYRRIFVRAPKVKHSYWDVENLSALKCTISYNQYGGYCVPESSAHRPAAIAVLSGAVHEPETIEYMVANCRDRDMIHAGTFFGDFLPALSRSVNSNAVVWAFEPNRENFRCAKITLDINDATNVRLAHAGLGATSERLFVQTTDGRGRSLGGTSRITGAAQAAEGRESVDVVSIDEVVPRDRNVGILQLDVEGYEKEALSGALATIRRCLPILILEVLPDSSLVHSEWFLENVLSLGYQMTGKVHGNMVFTCAGDKSCS